MLDVASTMELLAVASTGLLCLRWLLETVSCRGSEGLGKQDGSNRTFDLVHRPGMPEYPPAATRGTRPRSGDHQAEDNLAGDAPAANCDSKCLHRCRLFGVTLLPMPRRRVVIQIPGTAAVRSDNPPPISSRQCLACLFRNGMTDTSLIPFPA